MTASCRTTNRTTSGLSTFRAKPLCTLISGLATNVTGFTLNRRVGPPWSWFIPLCLIVARMAKSDSICRITLQFGKLAPRFDVMNFDLYRCGSTMLAGIVIPIKNRFNKLKVFWRSIMSLAFSPISTLPSMRTLAGEIAAGASDCATRSIPCEESGCNSKYLVTYRTGSITKAGRIPSTGATPFPLCAFGTSADWASIHLDLVGLFTARSAERGLSIFGISTFGTSIFRHIPIVAQNGVPCNYH